MAHLAFIGKPILEICNKTHHSPSYIDRRQSDSQGFPEIDNYIYYTDINLADLAAFSSNWDGGLLFN